MRLPGCVTLNMKNYEFDRGLDQWQAAKGSQYAWRASAIGRPEKQRVVLRGMGLTRLHKVVELPDTPQTQGMIDKVRHLVRIES